MGGFFASYIFQALKHYFMYFLANQLSEMGCSQSFSMAALLATKLLKYKVSFVKMPFSKA